MKRFACLAIPFALAACGDNNSVTAPIDASTTDPDAASIDARLIDATEIDAVSIDAPPAVTYGGTISLLEAALLNPGASGTFFGQGVQASITFTQSDQVPAPVLEEMPGSPLGCKAWVYTAAQAVASSVGVDEGPVQINSPAGGAALLPACTFTAGVGYACPETATLSTGGVIGAGPAAGTATLTDLDTTYNAMNTTNRYVRISGATTAANNGVFPIVALGGANTIVYGNPAATAETIPAAGFHINLAGVGPTPSAPDPGFLLDLASVDFVHTLGGGQHIAAFTSTTTVGGSVGDDFSVVAGDLQKLNALPRDGSAFTFTCDPLSCPAGTPTASGTLINIVTTDAPTAGISPFTMPLPTAERVQIRCAALGQTAVTVPAAYSAFLMRAGITRIQATLIRPTLMGAGPAAVTSISGHAIVGYTN